MNLAKCRTLLSASILLAGLLATSHVPLMAQNGKAKKAEAADKDKGSEKDKAAGRKKYLSSEARSKGTKTNIDFDAASIDGERRAPAGVAIGGAKQDHEYDLINLRLRWHPEMIKSTSNLETGKGQ